MCALENSDDPDEIPHTMAFHQGLHYLLHAKGFSGSEEEVIFYLEVILNL